jgi:hypothetical protein
VAFYTATEVRVIRRFPLGFETVCLIFTDTVQRDPPKMSDNPVTLEFLARLIRNVQDEMRDFREQMTVQTAILLRLETAQNLMAEQLRAIVRQHQRFDNRLRVLEERGAE